MTGCKTNADLIHTVNQLNGISKADRATVLTLFRKSGAACLKQLIDLYLRSMNQDHDASWRAMRPPRPQITIGSLPTQIDDAVDILGIGGLFAYLNVPYQAHKHPGRYAIVTHPRDIWTFAAWTLHPEEDMDQRLLPMYQTLTLIKNEVRRILRRSENPRDLRFKSFKIDYASIAGLLLQAPSEFSKLLRVALEYVTYEVFDRRHRYAHTNLERNAATIDALRDMGRVGDNPEHDMVHMCGRIVFENTGEPVCAAKTSLKRAYGLTGHTVSRQFLQSLYGDDLPIFEDIAAGRLRAVRYPGGHFLPTFKENALHAARLKGAVVLDDAMVTRIIFDPGEQRYAAFLTGRDGEATTIAAHTLVMALGGYEEVIPVDGLSTLFAVETPNPRFHIHPTGMGEGGNIHIVPVWTLPAERQGRTIYVHLGKATNGAIMGRHPQAPKRVTRDPEFLAHLEDHLRKILPQSSRLIWLAATECGRPVSAKQGYTVKPLECRDRSSGRLLLPNSFEATGGCGLGANTAIIPEVQHALDRQPRGTAPP